MLLDVFFTFVSLNSPFLPQFLTLNVSKGHNKIGADGARAIADTMLGAADTTLHARVPGKPTELVGLVCVTRELYCRASYNIIQHLCLCL